MTLHLPVHDVVLYSLLVIKRNLNIENTCLFFFGGGDGDPARKCFTSVKYA